MIIIAAWAALFAVSVLLFVLGAYVFDHYELDWGTALVGGLCCVLGFVGVVTTIARWHADTECHREYC